MKTAIAATVVLAFLGITTASSAQDWPEIPADERVLTSVDYHPSASAVVLYERGRLMIDEDAVSSYLSVYRRIKILTEEGKEHGTIDLFSSDFFRVKDLQARTHKADGTIVDLPDDAVYDKKRSAYYNRMVTSFAMPDVEVGAIIEYQYKSYFDSIFLTRWWFFQSDLPVMQSQFEFVMPRGFEYQPLKVKTLANREIREENRRDAWGLTRIYTMERMPPVPDEPYRFPFEALSSRVKVLPTKIQRSTAPTLLDSWKSAISLIQGGRSYGYKRFRAALGDVKKTAKELTASLGGKREKAEAIYRFVRDEVVTEEYYGIGTGEQTARAVLGDRRGDIAEKALLLQCLLDAAGIGSGIGWTSPADSVYLSKKVPDLGQFEVVLVIAELGKEQVFLYPSDRKLAFGALPPELEGNPCLLADSKKEEWVTTPVTPAEGSRRLARIELDLDADGRLAGSGSLLLSGNQAWEKLQWEGTEEETQDAWEEWVEDKFPGFDITEVELNEQVEQQELRLSWRLQQREEEVLGDEASIQLAQPVAIAKSPFVLGAMHRLTPVHLSFAFNDRVELRLTVDPAFSADLQPRLADVSNDAGHYITTFVTDENGKQMTCTRELQIDKRNYIGAQEYVTLKNLFDAAATGDSEQLVLIRE
jgi:hypothetical protein